MKNSLKVSLLSLAALVSINLLQGAPDPTRWAEQIAEFEKDRLENEIPEGAVLCVGSSSMRMWHPRMERDLHPLTVIPRGFGGSLYNDVNHYFEELVAVYKPRAILIYEGDNDTASGMDPQDVLEDFRTFRSKVAELDPEIRIYVLSVKPSTTRWKFKDVVMQTNHLLAAECLSDPKLEYIDVFTPLLTGNNEPQPEIFIEDGVHLNNIGYNIWAGAIGLKLIPAELPYEN